METTHIQFNDTIAAVSTAPGVGAIGIVRLSGPQARKIIGALFFPGSLNESRTVECETWLRTHTAVHGHLVDSGKKQTIDEVVVTPFLSPHSYTGEDLIEIGCHGNPLLCRQILDVLISAGARLAKPGEFTQRAFLSGRIDLTQAEAVLDLIQAKTTRQSRAALSLLSGDLGAEIRRIRNELIESLSQIVAAIDFPEEVGDLKPDHLEKVIDDCQTKLAHLAQTARSGKFLRDGLRVSIVGRPNVGKSSLLNRLLNIERAIVTEIPGTTRDSIEELTEINGIPIILVDTAGIRETQDKVESIGIERTKQAINSAHVVLFLVDLLCGWQKQEEDIFLLVANKPTIVIGNKCDLADKAPSLAPDNQLTEKNVIEQLLISAKTGAGLERLSQTITSWALSDLANADANISLNDRQAILCSKASEALMAARAALKNGLSEDCLATDLKTAIDLLSEICGELVSEEIIKEVFANFCIGK